MLKIWLTLLLFLPLTLLGADKVEVYATHMDKEGDIIKASGDIVVLYKDYYLSAKDGIYDQKSGNLELFGNVRATQGSNYQLLGDYAKINIANKERDFRPFYMLDQQSDVWISGNKGKIKDKYFDVTTGMISGCNPNKPLWKMQFSSSNYDAKTKWMNLYNARLYIYDIPVFYTPYFGYTLDTTRRSGLLIPAFGVSADEGFYYQQAIYLALQDNWDLEIRPQVRTSRGSGSYETFRFVDSQYSHGSITTGYFAEQQHYVNTNDLAHSTHYGFDFKYESVDFLHQVFHSDADGQSGIYADIKWMNDVDYINLAKSDTINNMTSNQLLSQVNTFYNTDRHYFGAYFKYYQNLALQSNAATIQKLPTIQYHNYLSTLLDQHLYYNVDVSSTNLYRELGERAQQTNLNIPLTLQTSALDEFLNLSYQSQFYAQHTGFTGSPDLTLVPNPDIYQNGEYLTQYSTFDMNTNLTKAYDDLTHTMIVDLQYVKPGANAQNGFYKLVENNCTVDPTSAQCEFYNIGAITEHAGASVSQYLFDDHGEQFLYHKLSQQMTYINGASQLGQVENELDYKLTKQLNYYTDTFYSYDQQLVARSINTMRYHTPEIGVDLSYLYRDNTIADTSQPTLIINDPNLRFAKYVTSNITYRYNDHYSYFAGYNYNIQTAQKKSAIIGFLYSKRCWDFGLRYVENIRPVLTVDQTTGLTSANSSIADRYIFFTITLKPIGGSEFNYRMPQLIQGP